MQMYHYEYLFKTLYSIFSKEKIIVLKFEDIFFDEGKSLENIFGYRHIEEFPSENKTKSNSDYKISTKGSKVKIPSYEIFEEAKEILNHSKWESFIPNIPNNFLIPKPIKEEKRRNNNTQTFLDLEQKIKSNSKSADILRDVALAFEAEGDIITAFSVMKKALELRPNGPFIKRKIEEYKKN